MLKALLKRGTGWYLLGVILCLAGYIFFRVFAPHGADAELSAISSCMTQRSFVSCVQPHVLRLLKTENGAQIMDTLEKKFSPLQCHYIGHIVGQELYLQYHSIEDAMNVCDLTCDSACAHGIIGQAFAEQLGYTGIPDVSLDLQHLNPEQIRLVGAKLCTSSDACHGVGHTLFAYYQKFAPAFAVCKEVSTGVHLPACASGVTMEYADDLSSKNFLTTTETVAPSPDSLPTLCDLPQLWQTRACYRYFPRMYAAALRKDFNSPQTLLEVASICKTQSTNEYRDACFAGLGSYQAFTIVDDPVGAANSCQQFENVRNQAACVLGAITPRTEDRKTQFVSFCETMHNDAVRALCYQDFFHALSQRDGSPMQGAAALCDANTLCLQGLKNYQLDSWEQMKNLPEGVNE